MGTSNLSPLPDCGDSGIVRLAVRDPLVNPNSLTSLLKAVVAALFKAAGLRKGDADIQGEKHRYIERERRERER